MDQLARNAVISIAIGEVAVNNQTQSVQSTASTKKPSSSTDSTPRIVVYPFRFLIP
jgi:hypothetical protein